MAIKIYFGAPGAGKTTHAAMIVARNEKKGIPTFSNVYIQGAYEYDANKDLGVYWIGNCDLIIDEAGIDFNSRKYKSLSQEIIGYLKKYRHFRVRDVYVYSQAPDDMDITLRRLSTEFYLLRRSIIPCLSYTRRIKRDIGRIDDLTKQLTDGYEYVPFSKRYYIRNLYFKRFDSWETPQLPEKVFKKYGDPSLETHRDSGAVNEGLSEAENTAGHG